jgi:formylglycine-generating enzyme required for sulfatase activity
MGLEPMDRGASLGSSGVRVGPPLGALLGAILGACLVGCTDLSVPLLGAIPPQTASDTGAATSSDTGAASLDDGGDAGAGACLETPSCQAGATGTMHCGPGDSGGECCCTSLEVEGGAFDRTYTVDADGGPTGLADPGSVSGFRLDKYDVTVDRFRPFVGAWSAGYAPPAGSGKHTHLNAGLGLANVASPGTYETGWLASDDINIAPTNANLACTMNPTWTPSTGSNENKPINCINWYEAYAFCIWDGGFLPSDTEWEYASAAGNQQREYPWGTTTPGTANQYAIYGCYYPSRSGTCTGVVNIAPVGMAPLGAAMWGQMDLVGDVSDWCLDAYASYQSPCLDCANLSVTLANRVRRGSDFHQAASTLQPWQRYGSVPSMRGSNLGFRCARTP